MLFREGQRWEFHNQTRETVTEYELTGLGELDPNGRFDALVHLTNLGTGGVAKVYGRALRDGPSRAPRSFWKLAS